MSETSASHQGEGSRRPLGPSVPVPPVPPERPVPLAAPVPPEVPAPPAAPMPPEAPVPPVRGKRFPEQEKISDPERMKALAHPARMAVFDFLGTRRVQGFDGATATEIADVAGMTPSAMSYHLRTLAKAGFIEEAPSRGDARERVWRLKLHSFSIAAGDDATEGDRIIERAMGQTFTDQQERNYQRWLDMRPDAPAEYGDASVTSQGRLRLTTEEAREFIRRFHELEAEYAELTLERAEKGVDVEDGSVVFSYLFRLFPHLEYSSVKPEEEASDREV